MSFGLYSLVFLLTIFCSFCCSLLKLLALTMFGCVFGFVLVVQSMQIIAVCVLDKMGVQMRKNECKVQELHLIFMFNSSSSHSNIKLHLTMATCCICVVLCM